MHCGRANRRACGAPCDPILFGQLPRRQQPQKWPADQEPLLALPSFLMSLGRKTERCSFSVKTCVAGRHRPAPIKCRGRRAGEYQMPAAPVNRDGRVGTGVQLLHKCEISRLSLHLLHLLSTLRAVEHAPAGSLSSFGTDLRARRGVLKNPDCTQRAFTSNPHRGGSNYR